MKSFYHQQALTLKLLFILLFIFSVTLSQAATVDTVSTFSKSMNKTIKAVVILPATYKAQQRFSTVYLLHGYGGNYGDYINKIPAIKAYADQYQMIIVCADGSSSWYLDSPVDDKWKYDTYISTELVSYTDQHYKTIANRNNRAITGLSMGGHGALSVAIKHQDVFGAAGSMSGGLDLRPFPANWEIAKRLGTYVQYPERWNNNSVMELTPLLSTHQLALIIDCGKDDFFYTVNKAFHEKLLYQQIPHDFIIRPGAHNWAYWTNSIGYQLLFFNNFFQQSILK
ncbi:alpha/beta hydrolase [Pedobacter sp.]|uniref:alpha/beta hydrolase n=1 Tax=Pedobacter sp. TaxID=1411316 RepID=UPI003D800173